MQQHPPLAYSVLKHCLPAGPARLLDAMAPLAASIIRNVIRSATHFGIAALAALERLADDLARIDLAAYLDLLWSVALGVRPADLVQELLLVLHERRSAGEAEDAARRYVYKAALGIAFDRAEEAADACPCDEFGRPRRQRTAPTFVRLVPPKAKEDAGKAKEDAGRAKDNAGMAKADADASADAAAPAPAPVHAAQLTHVMAHVRVDAPTPVRIHSHIRLRVASPEERAGPTVGVRAAVLDAVVLRAGRGELYLELRHPLPPEYARVDWHVYDAGSVATARAMMEAVARIAVEGAECCAFADIVVGVAGDDDEADGPFEEEAVESSDAARRFAASASLNESQQAAVASADNGALALIWGPPGNAMPL